MTVFRLATATVLLVGLALPAFAQGTATAVPSVPAMSERAHTMSGAAAPAATGPASTGPASVVPAGRVPTAAVASPVAPMSSAAAPTASAGVATPHAAVVPGTGRTGLVPATLPPRAELGGAEGRAERMGAERSARSHHRFASATRMERAPHGQGQTGEVAPDATR